MANPRGQQRDKPFRDALRMELAAAGEDRRKLRSIARAFLDKCETGDTQAVKELADRLDGKVPQGIENGEDGAFEVIQRIERVIVKASDQNG